MTVLAEVVRSGLVESRHHGSVVAVDRAGKILLSGGTPDALVFPRSASKPMQAVAAMHTGMADTFGFTDRHVAVIAASHSGEQLHLDLVREVLGRADVAESDLGCPRGWPLDETMRRTLAARDVQPSRIFHNCSGKHAGMLAACVAAGWPIQGYTAPNHPLQVSVRSVIEVFAGEPVQCVGVDGCGAPVFATSLTSIARSFAMLATAAPDSPAYAVAAAMRAHPEVVGGTGRDVTDLMRAVPGLLAKDGAEGVYAAVTADGIGVAIKIDDGAARARMPVLIAALQRLGALPTSDVLDALARPAVLGGGDPVGEVRAVDPGTGRP
ncbi:MAG: asparaginase [Mycobacteriales bacterium]